MGKSYPSKSIKGGRSVPGSKSRTIGKSIPIQYQQNRSPGGKFLPKSVIFGGKTIMHGKATGTASINTRKGKGLPSSGAMHDENARLARAVSPSITAIKNTKALTLNKSNTLKSAFNDVNKKHNQKPDVKMPQVKL